MKRVRLDLLLVKKGLAESREKAKAMIMAGIVEIDRLIVDKPGHLAPESSNILIKGPSLSFVSRGGLKLEAALESFSLDVQEKVILDAGASTGGFTDCLLQRGARKVIAVDVGYGQIHWRLRQDNRVTLLERTNIRYLQETDLAEKPHGAVIDVSFISLRLVLPVVCRLLQEEGFMIALVKPQFEVGKGQVGKGGVVRDPSLHQQVVRGLYDFSEGLGLKAIGHIESPITGPKGNKEFLLYLKK